MISDLLSAIGNFVVSVISHWSYLGVVVLMAIESANIPLPSEIIMPFAGYLVSAGQFNLIFVAVLGALGNVLGSLISYWVGRYGGRPLIERYGKYILVSRHDLDLADKWFARFGDKAVFFGRLVPVVRTFISFPAGISRVSVGKFTAYTFLGAFPFSLLLAFLGFKLGQNWENLRVYFRQFDILIALLILAAIIWYIWRHVRNVKRQNSKVKS